MEKGESSGLPAGGEDYSQATQKLVAFLTSFEEGGLDDVDYTDEESYQLAPPPPPLDEPPLLLELDGLL